MTKHHRIKRRGRLMSGFELVLDKSAVQTPRQMYANLARVGYNVQYKCAPRQSARSHTVTAHGS